MMEIKNIINSINVYNLMIFNLFIFSLFGIFKFGYKSILPQLLISIFTACFLDTLINYFNYKKFEISKSGVITGFFIALVLTENQKWYIILFACVIAILIKKLSSLIFKKYIFNPAMIGIFISILLFKTSDGWWGAYNLILVIILGLFLTYKFKRFDLILTFLLTYFLIYSLINGFSYNLFLNSTLYFFVFFMFIEPRTSPLNSKLRMIYGLISAIVIILTTLFIPNYSFTLGLLICNLFVPLLNSIKSRLETSVLVK